jgi:hypothetical protein
MRANEFLSEVELNKLTTPTATTNNDSITINIPVSLLKG